MAMLIFFMALVLLASTTHWIRTVGRIARTRRQALRSLRLARVTSAECRSFRRELRQTDRLVEALRAEDRRRS